MTPILHAELEVANCDARFLVNDILVGRLRHRHSIYQALPIHEFLVQGINTLRIERVDAPATGPAGDGPLEPGTEMETSARLRVAAYEIGMTPGNDTGRVIDVLEYKSLDPAKRPVASAYGEFTLETWPFRWSWQALPPTDWKKPSAVQMVFRFLQEFSQRFKAGDVPAVKAMLLPKMNDYCQAYGLDLGLEITELKGRMARRAADPSFAMAPFGESDLVLRSCADGRLVDCQIASGEPAIRWKDARVGNRGAMVLRLGLVDQRLQVFR